LPLIGTSALFSAGIKTGIIKKIPRKKLLEKMENTDQV
jgi:hypothetical protein